MNECVHVCKHVRVHVLQSAQCYHFMWKIEHCTQSPSWWLFMFHTSPGCLAEVCRAVLHPAVHVLVHRRVHSLSRDGLPDHQSSFGEGGEFFFLCVFLFVCLFFVIGVSFISHVWKGFHLLHNVVMMVMICMMMRRWLMVVMRSRRRMGGRSRRRRIFSIKF